MPLLRHPLQVPLQVRLRLTLSPTLTLALANPNPHPSPNPNPIFFYSCTICAAEIGRQSKSIDLARQRCGVTLIRTLTLTLALTLALALILTQP